MSVKLSDEQKAYLAFVLGDDAERLEDLQKACRTQGDLDHHMKMIAEAVGEAVEDYIDALAE